MQFKGTAFPPKSSERHQAILNVAQTNSLSLIVADNIFSCDQQHAEVTAPVSNLPVRFKLPNGWVLLPNGLMKCLDGYRQIKDRASLTK